ncbi:MAG: HAMP domain-containing protein [Candidatus Rokubacteria bacterium]|nr:HAMP domain-containing protein [Candidatus Rokubacteria bacterium]
MMLLDLLQRRLRVKVIALIAGILIVGFGLLVILNIGREAQVLVDANHETARLLAASILGSIQSGMLQARPDVIRRLVQDLRSELKDVRRLDVYRANGVEAFSDLETLNRVNQLAKLDPEVVKRIYRMHREPGERISHPLFTRAVETITSQETYESLDGGRVLTLFRPLENRKRCQACHGEDHRVRGVVRITLGVEKLDAELRAARNRQIVIAALTILGVAATVVVFLGRVVLEPIARVAAAARRVGAGDFDVRVATVSRDEIGDLGRVINDMADHLKAARADLEARNAELATTLHSLRESMEKVALLEQVKGELAKFRVMPSSRPPCRASRSRWRRLSCSSRSRASWPSSCPSP